MQGPPACALYIISYACPRAPPLTGLLKTGESRFADGKPEKNGREHYSDVTIIPCFFQKSTGKTGCASICADILFRKAWSRRG